MSTTPRTRTWTAAIVVEGAEFPVPGLTELADPNVPGFGYRVSDLLKDTKQAAVNFAIAEFPEFLEEGVTVRLFKTTKSKGTVTDREHTLAHDGTALRIY